MKMCKKAIFPLLGCLMALALLSGCSGQQAIGHASGGSEVNPPEQSVEEAQPPSLSAGQTEKPLLPENETITPDVEPMPPVPETPDRAPEPAHGNTAAESAGSEEKIAEMKMTVQVGASTFTAILEDNAAVDTLVEMLGNGPVTIQMSDYAGFEKVGALGTSLPNSNSQTTTQAGDIVLYQGNQIVLFYGSNSWSYTRLGRIDDLTGWTEALGSGDVSVTFSLGVGGADNLVCVDDFLDWVRTPAGNTRDCKNRCVGSSGRLSG